MPSDPQVVILGGGPCGLYAARTLARKGIKATVLEKEAIPGGLATSQKRGDNFYDVGVHMLHEFDREVFEDVKKMMGDERIEVPLDAKIRWAGAFYRYPLQFNDMLKGIPPITLATCVAGLFYAQARNSIAPWEPKDAEEALIQLYGYPLYEFFFKDFTHRYWGIPPQGLSAAFIKRKMPRLSAVDVLKKVLAKVGIKEAPGRAVESALLEETLHYSKTGAEAMPRKIAEALRADGVNVICGADVTRIITEGGKVAAVEYQDADGNAHRVACDQCISTMPLPHLVQRFDPPPPPPVAESAGRLRFKAITVYGMLVAKEKAIDGLYIYYRERIFHRVGEPKNAGLAVDPPDHTVLIVETTCEIGDGKWEGSDEIKEQIFADLEAERICKRDEIKEIHLLRAPNGYPIFELGFEEHYDRVMDHLNAIPNLQSVGRQGG
ncbi:MAG: FAD-dependent oxidoreductase, partial [Verrucomicrobiales bacterium]